MLILTNPIIYRTKHVTFEELKNGSTIPLQCKCDECGKVFETNKHRIVRNGHQLCQQCALRIKQRKDLPVGSKWGRLTVVEPANQAGYSICKCDCGAVGKFNNMGLKRGTTTSCGCYQREVASHIAKTRFPHPRGAEHPMWKGGVIDERHSVEASKEYKAFHRAVLERDGHRCRKCGSDENLCVHHVLDFMGYPELRCEVDNGITLCRTCHNEFHNKYGRGSKAGCGKFGKNEMSEFLSK